MRISDGAGSHSFDDITKLEVYQAFHKVKSRAVGFDSITYDMILFSLNYIVSVLNDIYTSCLRTDTVLDIWKISIFSKKAKIESLSELRPINMLPIMSKMLHK